MSTDALADEFTGLRPRLTTVAYRLTGSVSDAEDAVQESWLRLAGLTAGERAAIRDLTGWLTTVVGRICLDRLRSAAVRRERYLGQWLPEPVVTPLDSAGDDPLEAAVRDEGVRMAANTPPGAAGRSTTHSRRPGRAWPSSASYSTGSWRRWRPGMRGPWPRCCIPMWC